MTSQLTNFHSYYSSPRFSPSNHLHRVLWDKNHPEDRHCPRSVSSPFPSPIHHPQSTNTVNQPQSLLHRRLLLIPHIPPDPKPRHLLRPRPRLLLHSHSRPSPAMVQQTPLIRQRHINRRLWPRRSDICPRYQRHDLQPRLGLVVPHPGYYIVCGQWRV